MRTIDLPLTIRHDLERLGLDNTSLVEADGGGCTLRFTHDQLTEFADRLGSDAMEIDRQIDTLEARVEDLGDLLTAERLNLDAATTRAEIAEARVELLEKRLAKATAS